MNYKDLKISLDETHFLYKGKTLWQGKFKKVLKFHAPGLAPVQDASGWFHIDATGTPLYRERYDRTFGYYYEKAAVIKQGKWFHIDAQGKRIYWQEYAWCGNFQDNVCAVRDFEGNYFHIDAAGNPLYPQKYRYAGDFKDGIAAVKTREGKYKHILLNGKELNGKSFLNLGVFHKSFAVTRDEKGWFHIDKQGKELYTQRYKLIEPFYNGFAWAQTFDDKELIIDEQGKIVVEL